MRSFLRVLYPSPANLMEWDGSAWGLRRSWDLWLISPQKGKSDCSSLGDVGCRRAFLHVRWVHHRQPVLSAAKHMCPAPSWGGLSPWSTPLDISTQILLGGLLLTPNAVGDDQGNSAMSSGSEVQILSLSPFTRGKLRLKGFSAFSGCRLKRSSQL